AADLQRLLDETVRRMSPPPEEGTTVAVEGTGLAPGAISTFLVNRVRDHGQGLTWRHWGKGVVVAALPRQLMLAQRARRGPCNDERGPRVLLQRACHLTFSDCVLADGECNSERNQPFIRQELGALSVTPATRGKATWHVHGIRAQMRAAFPSHLYRQ